MARTPRAPHRHPPLPGAAALQGEGENFENPDKTMPAMVAEIEPTPGHKAHPPVAGDAFAGGTAASRTMFFKRHHGRKLSLWRWS